MEELHDHLAKESGQPGRDADSLSTPVSGDIMDDPDIKIQRG